MTNEEYRNLKSQAHQQLVEDYHWLMSQSPAQYTWRCPQRWLIELVYNANQDRPVDEWQRDIPLTRLYRDFFTHIGTKPPNHPSTQLSKLRNMERRRDIQPDSITHYYMQFIGKQLNCHIIEKLLHRQDQASAYRRFQPLRSLQEPGLHRQLHLSDRRQGI